MSKIVAIVVTYNRRQLLEKCVNALLLQKISCDIVIIDNASTDGTQAYLGTIECTRIHVIRNKVNSGGAGGFHQGVQVGIERGYDYLWLMDDDTFPCVDALAKLMNAASKLENFGFLSSLAMWTDGKPCRMNVQKITKKWWLDLDKIYLGLLRVQQATFVSLLVQAQTIKKVGLPVKEFFIWGDDIEFTRRIAVRHSIPSYLVGGSKVIHAAVNNCGSNIAMDSGEKLERYFFAFRNENYLYRQEGGMGWGYYLSKCVFNIFKIFVYSKDRKMERIVIILKAMIRGMFFNPTIKFVK